MQGFVFPGCLWGSSRVFTHSGRLCSAARSPQPRCPPALPPQLGIPHSFALISYQHKFQDDDQTRVKGSLK